MEGASCVCPWFGIALVVESLAAFPRHVGTIARRRLRAQDAAASNFDALGSDTVSGNVVAFIAAMY